MQKTCKQCGMDGTHKMDCSERGVHYFIRVNGELFEIQPLTHATVDNPTVKAFIIRTAKIQRVHKSEIIHSH